jgi:hypothetical protein
LKGGGKMANIAEGIEKLFGEKPVTNLKPGLSFADSLKSSMKPK